MKKGFIDFDNSKIAFVIDDEFKLELFGDNKKLSKFTKSHNFKQNYILSGQCYENGFFTRHVIFMVKFSLSTICYIDSYAISNSSNSLVFNEIVFSSKIIDNIFQFNYNARTLLDKGINITQTQSTIFSDTFVMDKNKYCFKYVVGTKKFWPPPLDKVRLCSKFSISTIKNTLEECTKLCVLMERFLKFMYSFSDISFDNIALMNNNHPTGHLYFNLNKKNDYELSEMYFRDTNPQFYSSKILSNLALNLTNDIDSSIPLGHIKNFNNRQSPQRFIEQIFSFEYIYAKLYPGEKNKKFQKNLEIKLQESIEKYGNLIHLEDFDKTKNYANLIKELRRQITHGQKYYYEFKDYGEEYTYMIIMDSLIEVMSLSYVGFADEEIKSFRSIYYY